MELIESFVNVFKRSSKMFLKIVLWEESLFSFFFFNIEGNL